jgi:hypothetical protein
MVRPGRRIPRGIHRKVPMRRSRIVPAAAVAGGLAALLLAAAPAAAYTLSLSAADIEAVVAPAFPQVQDGPFGEIAFAHPKVVLTPGSDRLGLGVDVTADLPAGMQATARAVVDGELSYDPARREFHLREPRVKSLTADGLPDAFAPLVADAVTRMARETMPVIVLYRLPDDPALAPLRLLKSAAVKDGKVVIELGM